MSRARGSPLSPAHSQPAQRRVQTNVWGGTGRSSSQLVRLRAKCGQRKRLSGGQTGRHAGSAPVKSSSAGQCRSHSSAISSVNRRASCTGGHCSSTQLQCQRNSKAHQHSPACHAPLPAQPGAPWARNRRASPPRACQSETAGTRPPPCATHRQPRRHPQRTWCCGWRRPALPPPPVASASGATGPAARWPLWRPPAPEAPLDASVGCCWHCCSTTWRCWHLWWVVACAAGPSGSCETGVGTTRGDWPSALRPRCSSETNQAVFPIGRSLERPLVSFEGCLALLPCLLCITTDSHSNLLCRLPTTCTPAVTAFQTGMEETLEGSPRRVRPQSISSVSQLPLQGWAMLADSCPDCGVSLAALVGLPRPVQGCRVAAGCRRRTAANQRRPATLPLQVPLMRHPSTAELLCVNCGNDPTAAPAMVGPPPPAAATEAAADVGPPAPTANGIAGHGSSSDEDGLLEAPPPLRTRLQPAQASAAAAAPSPQVSNAAQPAASRRSTEGGGGSNTAWIRQAGANVSSSLDARPAAGGSTHDASKEIAELMLEGWAMLQDHCPRWAG